MDHEKIGNIREALLDDSEAARGWAELSAIGQWTRLKVDDEGLLLEGDMGEVLIPPGPQLVWLKGLKQLAGRLAHLTEISLSDDLENFFDPDELLLYLRGDRDQYQYHVGLDVDGLAGRYGECLMTHEDCHALVRSIVAAKGTKGLANWIHDNLDIPVGAGQGPLSGSYDLKFRQPPPEWFRTNVFGCAGQGEPQMLDLVDYEPSSYYIGFGELWSGELGEISLRIPLGQEFTLEDLTEVTWSGWFEAKEHPGTPVNQFRLPGGTVDFTAAEPEETGRSWKIYSVDEVGVLEAILDPSSSLRDFVQLVS